MAKDVNIHIKAEGAEQTKQRLDAVGQSARQVGEKAQAGGRKGAAGIDDLSRASTTGRGAMGRLGGAVTSFLTRIGAAVGAITILTRAFGAQQEAIRELTETTLRQQNKLLSLQYLGDMFKERPELRKEVAAFAEYGRRPFEEVAGAWYSLRSKTAALSTEQRMGIMREALELGRIQPEMPLDTLVDMFSLYVKETKETDINKVQNVLKQTIEEAGGGGADVARYFPQFLPIGLAGGLSAEQAAGVWSYITTKFAQPAVATTGLRAVFMGLQGKGTPQAAEMLEQLGVTPEMDFFSKLAAISRRQAAGKFGLGEAEMLAQREGATALLAMLKDIPAMMRTVTSLMRAGRMPGDLTAETITELMGTDDIARTEEEVRRLNIAIENQKGASLDALRWARLHREYELLQRRAGVPEVLIRSREWTRKGLQIFGISPQLYEEDLSGFVQPSRKAYQDYIDETGAQRQSRRAVSPIINHYDYSNHYHPRAGGDPDDPGPRFEQY